MNSQYFTEPIIKMIHAINLTFKGDIVFCGSFGLVYNGLLDREIGDIDAITLKNSYTGEDMWHSYESNPLDRMEGESGRFAVGEFAVASYKLCLKDDNKAPWADIMFVQKDGEPYLPSYSEVDFFGVTIKIENPENAIIAKKQYIASAQPRNRDKHTKDLKQLDADWKLTDFPAPPENIDDIPF